MKSMNPYWVVFLLVLMELACNFSVAPLRSPQKASLTINTRIPQKVERGEEYEYVVITDVGNSCYGGVKYLTTNDEWTVLDFQMEIADENGICNWKWMVPTNAKNGLAEFRAYVEKDKQTNYSLPDDFCIATCQ